MLRTTAITRFFNENLSSPHIDTLLLTTPSGKLLSLSSPLPVSLLRTQATLAAQLWTSYVPVARSNVISASLPSTTTAEAPPAATQSRQDLKCITVQLEQGIMVIRQLNCSLLFIAIGPAPLQRPPTAASITSTSASTVITSRNVTPTPYHTHPPMANPQSPPAINGMDSQTHLPERVADGGGSGSGNVDRGGGSSVRTTDTRSSSMGIAASMNILQKQAEELAKWLNTELADFEFTPS